MLAAIVFALVCINAPFALSDVLADYVRVANKNFETGTAAVPVTAPNQTLDACAQSCSSKSDCQSFIFNGNKSTCVLQPLRRCQLLAIRPVGVSAEQNSGDIYEKKASVSMGSNDNYTPLFKNQCGTYTGAEINKTRQSTLSSGSDNDIITKFAGDCGSGCLTIRKPTACKSFLTSVVITTMANGSTTLDMTCTLFRDSIYSTPGHGFYSISNTAQCAGNQTTIYGLGVQETSQLNCGVGLSERPVVA